MKVKYKQLFSNDCGIAAIKNLLHQYNITFNKIDVNLKQEGTSLFDIKEVLLRYFYKVEIVSFNITELKKVKNFKPYITIIENKDFSHYVVIYKKDNKYVYILDSLFNRSYKMTYDNFAEIDGKKAVIVDDCKKITSNKLLSKIAIIIPIISFFESICLLYSMVLLQQIIDNGYKDAIFYIIIQILVLLFTFFKARVFLKTFLSIDKQVIYKINKGVFNLKSSYYQSHNIDEIFYRTFDAYSYKSMYLEFVFNMIGDFILCLFSYLLIISYSNLLAILLVPILILAIIISIKIFKKSKIAIEEKRQKEYEFISFYKDSFKDEKYKENKMKEKSLLLLKQYQESDYKLEKININKRLVYMCFQSFIVSSLVLLYFTKLYEYLSVGSLIALINLVSLMLQPLFNICSEISMFSNYKLTKDRINDVIDNIK